MDRLFLRAGRLGMALALALACTLAAAAQRVYFPTPDEGFGALITALRKPDFKAVDRLLGPGHQRIYLRFIAHITAYIQRAQLLRQRLAARIVHIHDHRLGAFGRKAADAGLANALGATRDDADAITKAEVDAGCGRGLGAKCHGR